jgi:CRISPR-associated endonuclease Cas1
MENHANSRVSPEISGTCDGWAERCQYWLAAGKHKARPGRRSRRTHEPLVLTGHGMRLNVQNGALVIHGGFTHYPQRAKEWRFFPGDPNLPTRIVILDGSGSLSFEVMDWLTTQQVPLIRINWRGEVRAVLGGAISALDPKKVAHQLEAKRNGRALAIAIHLIGAKIANCVETLHEAVPPSRGRDLALSKIELDAAEIRKKPPRSIGELLGIEGRAANAYFAAWHGIPIRWKGLGRKPIPTTWHHIERRSTAAKRKITNRNASHPVNAMLNYAYAVIESQVRVQVLADGYDPNIGYFHKPYRERSPLVFDLVEPLRPVMDRKVLEFVQSHTFHPADLTIRADGVCRLNPEMARHIANIAISVPTLRPSVFL